MKRATKLVQCAVILHNICILFTNNGDDLLDDEDLDIVNDELDIDHGGTTGQMAAAAAAFPMRSLHDARVLPNSSIYQKAKNGEVLAAGPMYLMGADEIQPYLVGDSAYPLSPWLQKPYPEGTRDPGEIRFNKELSSARVLVESAFGILKSLWRILDVIEERNIAAVSKIIVACAVLHNFSILAGDEWDKDDFNDDDDNGPNNNDDVLRDGDDIRDLFKNNL
ncbi:uncharacterized protein [Acropora muricata]|uniref:uncharacterized protein n=1 Tax=Acropora muricata TaxID=159855 RepID=UPI0034E3A77E